MIPYIILAIENPEDEAFMENLYLSYQQSMLYHIRKVLPNSPEAEDILQTALEKLIDKIPLLKTLAETNRKSYVITVCRREAINFLRKNKQVDYMGSDDLDLLESQTDTPELWVLRQEHLENAYGAWQDLDEKVQTILKWKYQLRMTDAEIGEILGIKPDSVRMRLTRARKNFKDKLQEIDTV